MAEFVASTKNLELPAYDEQMRWGYYLVNAMLGPQTISLKYANERGSGIIPQGIIVDTMEYTGGPVNILWDQGDINFPIVVGAGVQVSMMVPAKSDVVFTVTPASGSTGTIRIDLTNFPLLPVNLTALSAGPSDSVTVVNTSSQPVPVTDQTLASLINATSGSQTTSGATVYATPYLAGSPVSSGNALPVSDTTLAPTITSGAPATSGVSTASTIWTSGAAVSETNPLPVADTTLSGLVSSIAPAASGLTTIAKPSNATLVSGSATASGSTTIGTPPANSNLRKLLISATENSAQATAGEDLLTIALDAITVFSESIYIPAAGLTTNGTLYQRDIDFSNVAFNAGAAGTLTASLATALTSGSININAYFD